MKIDTNISLKDLNTFKVDVKAKTVLTLECDNDFSDNNLKSYLNNSNFLILGGGSNTLFTKDFDGTVILIKNKGIEILKEDESNIEVEVQAGEEWESFVKWSIENNLVGLHNLALIPGSTGATPVQNVGAYGVEIKDFLIDVTVLDLDTHKEKFLTNPECNFGYRDSIFKNELKNKIIIKSIRFRLPKYKNSIDDKYLQYAGIKENIEGKDITPLSVYNAVVKLRESKLPCVEEYGSCGSTFKNPEVSLKEYKRLLEIYPELPKYETSNKDIVKIPAAYILEKLGWKNKRIKHVGTWTYHPLIVTNYKDATGSEIFSFIKEIQSDFKYNTGISLETEINILN